MINTSLWLNLAVFINSLAGFICLALASDRQGEFLLHHTPSQRERLLFRVLGWPLLVLALVLCIQGWGASMGVVSWLGWLTVAGAGLTFYLPWWPWQEKKPVRARPAPVAKAGAAEPSPTPQETVPSAAKAPFSLAPRNLIFASSLLAIPAAFAIYLAQLGPAPIFRADALQGQIGPWPFVLAETNEHAPVLSGTGPHHTKSFQIRFCESCDTAIRSAYLQIRKPDSKPSPRQAFGGVRWTRAVDITIPHDSELEHQLWLTVEAKNGELYHQAFDFHQVSPATAAFIQKNL
ncbi:DUF3325 domain-containing protein [Alcaligenes parafaecalis]|uniref:DUF3325 domain-containing protein n=1 Tax=Alcaligenes parafaecalis TaxID=171260 RepID=A0ABT3VKT4_9BURK|nr:DUF3325 domain-containing protein [Alcaligenes parafaecalis]MCX5462701.1 DUF3325 domain-containing protein [Alcaligenes parafaecalis]